MSDETRNQRNREIMKTFLEIRQIPKEYKAPYMPNERNPYGFIYCIENKKDGKKYIGSTYSVWTGIANPDMIVPLKKRASTYLYEYNHATLTTKGALEVQRPIIQAMVTEGIENFVMYPVAETTKYTHKDVELYFIKKFDTIKNGYNYLNTGGFHNRGGLSRPMTEAEKKQRSEPIIAVNLNLKQLVFADSMKLFGEYMETSKDMIKNKARSAGTHKGWFVFYTNESKRHEVLKNVIEGEISYIKAAKLSSKKIEFYKGLVFAIDGYLKDYTSDEYFSDFKVLPPITYKVE